MKLVTPKDAAAREAAAKDEAKKAWCEWLETHRGEYTLKLVEAD